MCRFLQFQHLREKPACANVVKEREKKIKKRKIKKDTSKKYKDG